MQQVFPCPKCGTQIPVGQQLCSTCGQRFEYRCRRCGAAAKTPSGFCINCGEKLAHQTQLSEPSATKVMATHRIEKARREKAIPEPVGHVGRYLIALAIIIFIGAIFYTISTSMQGDTSSLLGGGFIFGGKSPPSTPPITDGQLTPKPKPASDSPQYTTSQVIAAAKKLSPICRAPTRRTG